MALIFYSNLVKLIAELRNQTRNYSDVGIISLFVNRRFSESVGHKRSSDSASVGHAGQSVGQTMISRPLPSRSVLDFGC